MFRSDRIFILFVLLLLATTASAQQKRNFQLFMFTFGDHLLADSSRLPIYGFYTSAGGPPVLPGPRLTAEEGDTLEVYVYNRSRGAPHTIHWHGLDVDQANDGVPQTSFSIYHQQDCTYTFVASHAGTYLYHCHVATVVHVQMGMYGGVVVKAAGGENKAWTGGPTYDKDYLWLLSEVDRSWHDSIPLHNTGDSVHEEFFVPPYRPDHFFVNGGEHQQLEDPETRIEGRPGEKVYLRLANVGFFGNEVVFPADFQAAVLSSDGRPLPVALRQDTLQVLPGERYGVMLTLPGSREDSVQINYWNLNQGTTAGTVQVPVAIGPALSSTPWGREGDYFDIFPNPGKDFWWIEMEQAPSDMLKITLMDLQGRLVVQQEFIPNGRGRFAFVQKGLSPGLYLLKVQTGGKYGIKKLMVK